MKCPDLFTYLRFTVRISHLRRVEVTWLKVCPEYFLRNKNRLTIILRYRPCLHFYGRPVVQMLLLGLISTFCSSFDFTVLIDLNLLFCFLIWHGCHFRTFRKVFMYILKDIYLPSEAVFGNWSHLKPITDAKWRSFATELSVQSHILIQIWVELML